MDGTQAGHQAWWLPPSLLSHFPQACLVFLELAASQHVFEAYLENTSAQEAILIHLGRKKGGHVAGVGPSWLGKEV